MHPVWALRRAAWVRDGLVSPDVFPQMGDRLGACVMPSQPVRETAAGQRHVHLSLQGLLSHLPGKHAADSAPCVYIERQGLQACLGPAPGDHRPLIHVLVAAVADRLGEPEGILACDPSRFPKRGTHAVGVKRPWGGHRGNVDTCPVGGFMGEVGAHAQAVLDFRLALPEAWAREEQRRQACHVPQAVRYHTRHEPC